MPGQASVEEGLTARAFGYPSPQPISHLEALLVFWALEDCICTIRRMRLAVG